jgi:hypothetical protein
MVNPSLVPGDHNLFICGNDAPAKKEVKVDDTLNVSRWIKERKFVAYATKFGSEASYGCTAGRGTSK